MQTNELRRIQVPRKKDILGKGDPLGGSISCYIDICLRKGGCLNPECRQTPDDSRDFY